MMKFPIYICIYIYIWKIKKCSKAPIRTNKTSKIYFLVDGAIGIFCQNQTGVLWKKSMKNSMKLRWFISICPMKIWSFWGSSTSKNLACLNLRTWVISHVPMFHITQPLDSMIGINGLLDGYYFGWCPIYPSHGTFNKPCRSPPLWWPRCFFPECLGFFGRIRRTSNNHHVGWWFFIAITGTHLSHSKYLGVSENSVPLNPMVNDHYPY